MLEISTSPFDTVFERIHGSAAKVTVAVSLHNYRDFVLEALDTVEAQSLKSVDLIVVDDHSTDDGVDAVRDWMARRCTRFERALLVRHRENRGLAATRNLGFDLAATPYVFVLDADNLLYPRCLEICLAHAEANDAEGVHPILEIFGERTGVMGTDLWDPDAFASGNYIDAMALVRRSAWQRVGGYRRMPANGWEDYDFWVKFAEAGLSAVRVPEILGRYRFRAASMLRTETNQAEIAAQLLEDMRLHHPSLRPGAASTGPSHWSYGGTRGR